VEELDDEEKEVNVPPLLPPPPEAKKKQHTGNKKENIHVLGCGVILFFCNKWKQVETNHIDSYLPTCAHQNHRSSLPSFVVAFV
jgi:hypothetical protein